MFQNSAKKKVTFQLECILKDLENLPYISGLYFAKLKLSQGFKAYTEKRTVKNNKVDWDAHFAMEATFTLGKDGVLLPCELGITFRQDLEGGRKYDDIGSILINLSEYADSRSTTRRYLLQNSKLNTFVWITINMRLIKGDPIYKVPTMGCQNVDDSILASASSDDPLRRGFSITHLLKRDQEAESPDFLKCKDILDMQNDNDAIDMIFQQAKSKQI